MRTLALPVLLVLVVALVALRTVSSATGEHDGHSMSQGESPSLGGQYAFATIAEIVALLDADPDTDWSGVDIAALRDHLVDMHRVTLESAVTAESLPDGVRFVVTGRTQPAIDSIRRMTSAHAMTMTGGTTSPGTRFESSTIEGGAEIVLRSDDPAQRLRLGALGFHGFLALGDHHPQHHLALAGGDDPHGGH